MKILTVRIITFILCSIAFTVALAGYDAEIYQAQQKLSDLGYSVGVVDGINGWKTKNALKSYQRVHNLKVTGKLDPKTKALLFELKTRDPGGIVTVDSAINKSYKNKRALVIGINAYPTMPLEAAVADATAVSKRLKQLNFEVITLINNQATKRRIETELGKLARTSKDDQVLIYFAGHGVSKHLHNKKLEGYILPVDVNLRDLYATAISMTKLRNLTHHIPAKHILYVFDSCYSGLGLSRATTYTSEYLSTLAGKRAVYMITAGKAGEVAREVGNHGIFTLNFLDGIAGAADDNKDKVVQASELGIYLASTVSKDTKNEQTPQHGLLEGDGDFLFPLQDDDPIRLRESQLVKLKRQTLILSKRQDLQAEFDKIQEKIQESDKTVTEQSKKKIAELDKQIQQKQAELAKLSKAARLLSTADLNRSPYSVMRFLNTGIEFNINKTFPNLKKAEEYYSKVFAMEVDLDKNGYQKDDQRKILLSRKPAHLLSAEAKSRSYLSDNKEQVGLSGIIDKVIIKTVTMKDVLKEIKHISSPLRQDNTTFVEYIHFIINNIDKNRLTFDQIKARLIARYGNPTSTQESKLKIINWKNGQFQPSKQFIWEDNQAGFLFRSLSDKDFIEKEAQRSLIEKRYITLEEYKDWEISTAAINIYLLNNSSILKSFYAQAYKIAETETLIIEKKANAGVLNF
jgi:peptidoglycan hydrolase-like protein with peptidoglycan-binding domain